MPAMPSTLVVATGRSDRAQGALLRAEAIGKLRVGNCIGAYRLARQKGWL